MTVQANGRRSGYLGVVGALAFLLLLGSTGQRVQRLARASVDQGALAQQDARDSWLREEQGTRVRVSVWQGDAAAAELAPPVAGKSMHVQIHLSDIGKQHPLSGAGLGVWIDARRAGGISDAKGCFDKVEGFVRGTLQIRPSVDLNSYFVLALNNGNSISVIDPFIGFGSSKLYTSVVLKSRGEDWVLIPELDRLLVTLPLVNEVAVVSTRSFEVESSLSVSIKPTRIVAQPDHRYVWVARSGSAGVGAGLSVIDPRAARVVKQIDLPAGNHDFAFLSSVQSGLAQAGDAHADQTRLAFISNPSSGTLSVIDIETLKRIAEIKTGLQPVSVAYSAAGRSIYVSHRGDGSILEFDAHSTQLRTRIQAGTGLGQIRFDPSGRWGFVLNPARNEVYVIDARKSEIRHTVAVGAHPDQIAFTKNFVYIRSTGSVDVSMIRLGDLDLPGTPSSQTFPVGQYTPDKFSDPGIAAAITPEGGVGTHMGDAVYVANPADKSIYFYHYMEGMPTPSGRLNNYGFEPRAVLISGRALRETQAGTYATTVIAPDEGNYELVFLLDEPRIIHCYPFQVAADPQRLRKRTFSLNIVPVKSEQTLVAGRKVAFRFRLHDARTQKPKTGLRDVALWVTSPTGWHDHVLARKLSPGLFEAPLQLPHAGVYYAMVDTGAHGFSTRHERPAVLRAVAAH